MGYFWALMSVLLVSCAQLMMKWAMVTLPPVGQRDAFISAFVSVSQVPWCWLLACSLTSFRWAAGSWRCGALR